MRILVFGNQAFSLVNFRAPLLEDLRRRGHEVHAMAPGFDADLRARLEALGVHCIEISLSRTGMNPLRDFGDMVGLWRTMRALKPDLLLAFTIKPVIYGTLIAALAGIGRRCVLITGLGYAFAETNGPRDRLAQGLAQALYRIALGRAHVIFMQNADDADEFAARKIVARERITLVNGTGVDLAAWPVLPLPAAGPITFTLAARLLGEKGIREFITAARRVRAEHADTRFVLLGGLDTNPAAIAEAEVRAWVDEGIVEWPGHVAVSPWLAQTHVYVLPSYREGVPRSTQEAMAAGRPVITTDVPGCRETVIDGENGYLVPVRDANALAEAMLRFAKDPATIATMGARSRQLAEQRFDVRAINQKMIGAMGA